MLLGNAAIGDLLADLDAPRADQERAIRFRICGHACEIVPARRQYQGGEGVVGSLAIDGERYVIVMLADPPADARPAVVDRLTRRELEIAVLIAAGRVNKQIAYQLGISCWTVATYVKRIYCKLGVTTRAEMTAKLIAGIADR